ncbi:MAG TPA: hypothetical protein VGF12_21365 [Roseateles sp.]
MKPRAGALTLHGDAQRAPPRPTGPPTCPFDVVAIDGNNLDGPQNAFDAG